MRGRPVFARIHPFANGKIVCSNASWGDDMYKSKLITGLLLMLFLAVSISTTVYADSSEYVRSESFEIQVSASGYYHILVNYAAVAGTGDILVETRVNGDVVTGAEVIAFARTFADESDAWRTQEGNQIFPSQIEIKRFTDFTLAASTARPISFWLEAGANNITFFITEGDIVFGGTPVAVPAEPLPTYAEYREKHANIPRFNGEKIVIQAQESAYKTAGALLPQNDRTCPLVTPYHPTYITLNTIGGPAWRVPGQRIEWSVYVAEAGLYRVALRYSQREKRGFSSRAFSINGEIPFQEAAELRFNFATGFRSRFLSCSETGEDFWFYFPQGLNRIGLEATLGVFYEISEITTHLLMDISALYQNIISITGPSPDRHRDYQILQQFPDFRERLAEQTELITYLLEKINEVTDGFAETNAILIRLNNHISRMLARPYRVNVYLIELQNSITALGNFLTSAHEQPLLLDVIGLAGAESEGFPGRANIFQRLLHQIRAFIGSFTNDFAFHVESPGGGVPRRIEVWVATGFDVFNILVRLINERFVESHPHISVDLRLVDAGIIFPASVAGTGPDVVLQAQAAMPINFAFRAGAIDLTQLAGFAETAERFAPAALETMGFGDAVFGLPDQMSFPLMFYRRDIFDDLGIYEAPETMDELLGLVPTLQARHMDIFFTNGPQPQLGTCGGMVGTVTRQLNAVHVGFLHQMGGRAFANDGAYTTVADDIGISAFRFWTDLYTKHNFIYLADVLTRFRVGDLPVVVADLGLVNLLNAAAPEIRGRWSVAPVPGLFDTNGDLRRDTVISVSSNFIVGNMATRNDTVKESWDFLKWFTSEEIQYRFAVEVEAVFGHNWRHQTANLEAFRRLNWGRQMKPTLDEVMEWLIAIPQVPGGYIAGRAIHNAFINVVVENGNPIDQLLIARDRIDDELATKRREFGLE